jgi:hypothetical protein
MLGMKKWNGRKILLNVPSWCCDEFGGPGVDSDRCKFCRCSRGYFVSTMCGIGPLGYLFEENNTRNI